MHKDPLRSFREWLEETHSSAFELRRHFFLRFFDSDFVSTPGQWCVVAGGVIALVASLSLIYVQAYFRKYRILNSEPTAGPFRLALIADELFVITLAMFGIAVLTTLAWPSLFPGLRDYLALAALPVRMRDIFIAKFSALLAFAALFTVGITFLPSIILPAVMAGPYFTRAVQHIEAFFISSSLAGAFVFFAFVAIQGVLLNVLPIRQFGRVSLAIQAALIAILFSAFPLVLRVPSLQPWMDQRPQWAVWTPPLWFLGLHEVLLGNREPLAAKLATISGAASVGCVFAAMLTYLWSYRRHRVRVLESPVMTARKSERGFWSDFFDNAFSDTRELGAFTFIAKTLARSRQHRLILTGFGAIALALIVESFVSLTVSDYALGAQHRAFREAVISVPLALSLFVLAGDRYLFRLPVESRANWIFRTSEAAARLSMLSATEHFLLFSAVIPVALLTLPIEMRMLGAQNGFKAAVLCAVPSLILMEVLLMQFEKMPFTCSYLPGQRPLVETVLRYIAGVTLYVFLLSELIRACLAPTSLTLGLFIGLLAIWWMVRRGRLGARGTGLFEFEETAEPAVQTLGITRD